jgi:hypothetical protein
VPEAERLADPERRRFLRSVCEPSSLEAVAEAVAAATEAERRIYVERVGKSFRWSLTHPGGGYPMLRITARFLRTDYHRVVVGFRKIAEGVYVLAEDPATDKDPDAWTVIEFAAPADCTDVKERIARALEPSSRK